jgi:DNA polymerase theta
MQFGIAKKIKNGARKIVLEEAEAARLAAFSAFKSLGVEVPQFTAPPLPTIEDSPTRYAMDSRVGSGDQANCNKLALAMQGADDKSNCSNYASAQRASTKSLAEDTRPGSLIQMNNPGIPINANTSIQEASSPSSTQITDKSGSKDVTDMGPVNACKFSGGFDCFLDQWSSVNEFSFDLHFVKKSTKSSLTLFEIFGLAVCWENSPIYYCNFPKDLVTAGNNDSNEAWVNFLRRWNKIHDIMQQKSIKKITWNLKIQIQALKSAYFSCQQLARFHLDHKILNNVEVLENSYVLLPPIAVYNGLDICLVAWVLWPDEESKTAPNLDKVQQMSCSAMPFVFHC